MFSVYGGNGQVHNVYRNGGWGWLCRMFGASIGDSVRDIWVYNNIDLRSTGYGTADIRVEAAQWKDSKLFKGVNVHIVNNTSGYKKDIMNYTTAVALIPNFNLGYTCEIKNNLSFNNQNPGRSGTGYEYWNVANRPDTGGNFYFPSAAAAGLKDSINCYLTAESPIMTREQLSHIYKKILKDLHDHKAMDLTQEPENLLLPAAVPKSHSAKQAGMTIKIICCWLRWCWSAYWEYSC